MSSYFLATLIYFERQKIPSSQQAAISFWTTRKDAKTITGSSKTGFKDNFYYKQECSLKLKV